MSQCSLGWVISVGSLPASLNLDPDKDDQVVSVLIQGVGDSVCRPRLAGNPEATDTCNGYAVAQQGVLADRDRLRRRLDQVVTGRARRSAPALRRSEDGSAA